MGNTAGFLDPKVYHGIFNLPLHLQSDEAFLEYAKEFGLGKGISKDLNVKMTNKTYFDIQEMQPTGERELRFFNTGFTAGRTGLQNYDNQNLGQDTFIVGLGYRIDRVEIITIGANVRDNVFAWGLTGKECQGTMDLEDSRGTKIFDEEHLGHLQNLTFNVAHPSDLLTMFPKPLIWTSGKNIDYKVKLTSEAQADLPALTSGFYKISLVCVEVQGK